VVKSFVEKQIRDYRNFFFDEKVLDPEWEPPETLESYIGVQYLQGVIKFLTSLEIPRAVNMGRDNAIVNIDGINIAFAQWSAILDEKTCQYCKERDEMIVSVDNPDYVSCQPPAHGFCRCIWIYITDEERTGEGGQIQADWTSPTEEEREEHRIFEIGVINDIETLADMFGTRSVRFDRKLEKRIKELMPLEDDLFPEEEEIEEIEESPF